MEALDRWTYTLISADGRFALALNEGRLYLSLDEGRTWEDLQVTYTESCNVVTLLETFRAGFDTAAKVPALRPPLVILPMQQKRERKDV